MDERKKLAPIGARPVRPANKGYGEAGASYTKKALKGFIAADRLLQSFALDVAVVRITHSHREVLCVVRVNDGIRKAELLDLFLVELADRPALHAFNFFIFHPPCCRLVGVLLSFTL